MSTRTGSHTYKEGICLTAWIRGDQNERCPATGIWIETFQPLPEGITELNTSRTF